MKALKGLLIYIGLVLAIILGIGIVLFGIMYFFPSFRIMGVGVIHYTKTIEEENIDILDYSNYSSLELNVSSKNLQVKIVPDAELDTEIQYGIKLSAFGIAFDITEYRTNKQVEVSDNVLKISLNATEPNGWISNSSSFVYVKVPKNLSYAMVVKTNNADVIIGDENNDLKITQLNVTTGSGNLTLNKIANSDSLTLKNLNLTTNTGKFDFTSVTNLTVQNQVKLIAENGDFAFKNLNASVDVKGSGIKLDAESITCDENGFTFISENGYFKIGTLTSPAGAENTIITENCDVQITTINGKTGIVTTYGNINVTTLNSSSILESTHGNVNIKTANDDISILTKFGNINVESYYRNGKFTSTSGDIDVKSLAEYEDKVYTSIINTDGKVVVDNLVNKLLIETYGRSNVSVTFRQIKTGLNIENVFRHVVKINKLGKCEVYLPALIKEPFRFIAKGNISGEIAALVTEYGTGNKVESREEYQYYPNVEQQGLTVNSCEFLFDGTIHFNGYQNAS